MRLNRAKIHRRLLNLVGNMFELAHVHCMLVAVTGICIHKRSLVRVSTRVRVRGVGQMEVWTLGQ